MYHLKEHGDLLSLMIPTVFVLTNIIGIKGMTSWVKEYVLKRGIPIPKLLHAFGINLVCNCLVGCIAILTGVVLRITTETADDNDVFSPSSNVTRVSSTHFHMKQAS